MSEPSLAAQAAIRAALIASPAVTSRVPASNIVDRNARPEITPCIIVGESYTVDDSSDCISAWEVYMDIHVWTREPGLQSCKLITGAVQRALRGLDVEGIHYAVSIVEQSWRFLRDPDGEHAHGVLSAVMLVEEI